MDKQTVMVVLHGLSVCTGCVPDGRVPDGRVPDGRVPDGRVPDGRVPDGRVPDEHSAQENCNLMSLQCTLSLSEVLLSLWRHYKEAISSDFVSIMAVMRKILFSITRGLKAYPKNAAELKQCCNRYILMAEIVYKDKGKLSKVQLRALVTMGTMI